MHTRSAGGNHALRAARVLSLGCRQRIRVLPARSKGCGTLPGLLAVAMLAIGPGGCGGGGKPGTPGVGTEDGGGVGPGGGTLDGGGVGPGDDGGQVLPPYRGRIVLTPPALLFTGAGQSATVRAQAFDATGAPMAATFTFTSSRPEQVAVDAAGNVTAMVPLGSTQITVTGGGLTSRPLLVLVVVPQPGTVLVSDAQVVAGPVQVDPTADPLPGAQFQVTLDGVGPLAAGTTLLSREGNAVAGQVVSTAPNGAHTDVVYQLVTLNDLFAQLDLKAGYDYNLQTAADDDAIAAMAAAAAPPGVSARLRSFESNEYPLGPFKCKVTVDPTLVKVDGNISLTPELHLDTNFHKNDVGEWTDASIIMSGGIKVSGKVTVKLTSGVTAALSCKYKWKTFVPPIFGPLSLILGPRVEVGAKGEIKGSALLSALEFGGKMKETASHFQLGISGGTNGTGDVASVTLDDPHIEPMYSVSDDFATGQLEISVALGAYATLELTAIELKLAEAFVGGKLKFQMMTLDNQVGSNTPNKYELKAPVREIGPGSDLKRALALFGIVLDFKASLNDEGSVIATSPHGTFEADNQSVNVPANAPLTFKVHLASGSDKFLGQTNVSGVHIYKVNQNLIQNLKSFEVAYLPGGGADYSWTWTPKVADEGQYSFVAAVDDEFIYAIDVLGVSAPFYVGEGSVIPITVGPPKGNWGGTITLTWSGSGQTTSGAASTENGSETITYVPGTPSPDGLNFDMKATAVDFTVTYGFTEEESLGACPAHRTYKATGSIHETGADADRDAHGLLMLLPSGGVSADYAFGVPGLSVNANFTDDLTSDCGTSNHSDGLVGIGATGTNATGMMKKDDDAIVGSTSYQASDGFGGETMQYIATWNLQRM